MTRYRSVDSVWQLLRIATATPRPIRNLRAMMTRGSACPYSTPLRESQAW